MTTKTSWFYECPECLHDFTSDVPLIGAKCDNCKEEGYLVYMDEHKVVDDTPMATNKYKCPECGREIVVMQSSTEPATFGSQSRCGDSETLSVSVTSGCCGFLDGSGWPTLARIPPINPP